MYYSVEVSAAFITQGAYSSVYSSVEPSFDYNQFLQRSPIFRLFLKAEHFVDFQNF